MTRRHYIGLAATLHDPALAIVGPEGEVLFAEAAERWLQDKRAFNAPPDHMTRGIALAREYCPADAELCAAVSWSGGLLSRLRWASLLESPRLRGIGSRLFSRRDHLVWPMHDYRGLVRGMSTSLGQAGVNLGWRGALQAPPRYYDHHLSHAAAACFTSSFDEAACAVVDGFGEWGSTAFYRYAGGKLSRLDSRRRIGAGRRGSLGMFYAMVCGLCGFDPLLGEEWKVMGLAPYGHVDEHLYRLLRPLLRVEGLELRIGCRPAEYHSRLERLRETQRKPGAPPLESADMARTGQQVFEETLTELLANLHTELPCENLVLGGGCALNSAWNGRICERTPFSRLHIPSAPADDGTALGAALLACLEDQPELASRLRLGNPFVGSAFSEAAVESLASEAGLARIEHLPGRVVQTTAQLLADGHIVAWMQGRAELGPRALGHRSILADPRDAGMTSRVNRSVKLREDFRPLAPAILHEYGPDYFDPYQESPYMERTLRFRPEARARVPAVVHVDGSGRVQSVRADWAPRFHALLSEFHALTGVPILLNTSFNRMGRPIVHSVEDAVATFLTSGLDALVIGDHLLQKRRLQ